MPRPRSSSTRLGFLLAAALLVGFSPGAAATHDNPGTLRVYDHVEETPAPRRVPHVSCGFYLEGFLLGDDTGWIRFFAWPPTGNRTEATPSGDTLPWTADAGAASGEFHLLKGPYYLPAGHYRVEIHTDDGHPGAEEDHLAKTKTFWVEPCDDTLVNPPCPTIVTAEARATSRGNEVALGWTSVANASAYALYRAPEGEAFEAVAFVDAGTLGYVDATTAAGVTYEYYVTAVLGSIESESCALAKVAAVPFFPSALAGAGVLALSVAAYAALRRR